MQPATVPAPSALPYRAVRAPRGLLAVVTRDCYVQLLRVQSRYIERKKIHDFSESGGIEGRELAWRRNFKRDFFYRPRFSIRETGTGRVTLETIDRGKEGTQAHN